MRLLYFVKSNCFHQLLFTLFLLLILQLQYICNALCSPNSLQAQPILWKLKWCLRCLCVGLSGSCSEQSTQHSANYTAAVLLCAGMRPHVAQTWSRCPGPAQMVLNALLGLSTCARVPSISWSWGAVLPVRWWGVTEPLCVCLTVSLQMVVSEWKMFCSEHFFQAEQRGSLPLNNLFLMPGKFLTHNFWLRLLISNIFFNPKLDTIRPINMPYVKLC